MREQEGVEAHKDLRDARMYAAVAELAREEQLDSQDLARALRDPASLFFPDLAQRLIANGIREEHSRRVATVMLAVQEVARWWPESRTRVQSPADLAAIATPMIGRAATALPAAGGESLAFRDRAHLDPAHRLADTSRDLGEDCGVRPVCRRLEIGRAHV